MECINSRKTLYTTTRRKICCDVFFEFVTVTNLRIANNTLRYYVGYEMVSPSNPILSMLLFSSRKNTIVFALSLSLSLCVCVCVYVCIFVCRKTFILALTGCNLPTLSRIISCTRRRQSSSSPQSVCRLQTSKLQVCRPWFFISEGLPDPEST